MNALANHGYFPRNGRNISLQQFISSIKDVYNFEEKITSGIVAVYQPFTTTGNNNTLNLNDLDHHSEPKPNIIPSPRTLLQSGDIANVSVHCPDPGEFDGSLSRSDLALGDNHSFNETIWNTVAAHFQNNTISIPTAAKARKDRFAAAQAANKEFDTSDATANGGRGTTALYLLVMRGQFRETKTKFVQIFFREFAGSSRGAGVSPMCGYMLIWCTGQDRIPFNEGWRRSNRTITMEELGGLVEKIRAAE
ncbi:MAG: hypothetical protein Q9200_001631 [Gallowayella weberi]